MVIVQNGDIFFVKISNIFRVLEIPDISLGEG